MNENQALTVGMPDEEFVTALNKATNYNTYVTPPTLKFDAQTGMWKISTDQRDAENKVVYQDIGDEIKFHIITARNMLQSTFNSQDGYYSKEFVDDYVVLYGQDKQIIFEGTMRNLKADVAMYEKLDFVKVLYVFWEDKPCRLKISRSKFVNFIPYWNSFKGDNPARYYTIAGRGPQASKGAVKYYELSFLRGDLVETELVVKRVNDLNLYLEAVAGRMAENVKVKNPIDDYSQPPHPALGEGEQPDYNSDEGDIKIEQIPF
jgi:hypothetical protein